MAEPAELVVDASIIARWHLKNPPYLSQSVLAFCQPYGKQNANFAREG